MIAAELWLILSGILSPIAVIVNPLLINTNNLHEQCASRNTLCLPGTAHSCCDQKDSCIKTEPDNVYRCIKRSGLGKYCARDDECDELWHSKCSTDKTCICRKNTIEFNETACAPVLGGFCWKNELCATEHAICINNECQCNFNNYRRLNDRCIFNLLGTPCESDDNCEQVRFAKCSEHKICSCSLNTFEVNPTQCVSLIGGFCWTTDDCLPVNSICVNNSCKCQNFHIFRSNNQCIAVYLNMTCLVDKECSQWIPHSICSLYTCICEKDYFAKDNACVPSINIYCPSDDSCKVDHSVCIDNMCQCKPRYMYRYSRCIPLYLNEPCKNSADCDQIQNARCSADYVCVCDTNHTRFDRRTCTPVLNEFCYRDEDCRAINSTCVMNECQCKPHFIKLSAYLCKFYGLGMNCKDNDDCLGILHSNCSVNKKCECISNYTEYNITTCAPLLGQYCSKTKNVQCASLNSICSQNICVCKPNHIRLSNNECIPYHLWMHCDTDEDCKTLLDSKCVKKQCDCKDNYDILNTTACAPLLGEFCKNNQQCAPVNSICNNNKCQCDSDYLRRFNNRCIPTAGYFKISCDKDDDCEDIKYAKCSKDKKCACKSNYVALGEDQCIALIDEYCDSDEECISYNTACINNKCQCLQKFVMRSKYQCDRVSIGSRCHKDHDCDVSIKNSVCLNNTTCVCSQNYYAFHKFECAPLLYQYCLNNEECRFNSSSCIDNKCQCNHNFYSVSANQCKPLDYMFVCNEDTDCGDPWHNKCFGKKCRCNSNNISIDKSTCLPLLNGYCWKDSQCFVRNSVCIDYQCKCKQNFMLASVNLCIPA